MLFLHFFLSEAVIFLSVEIALCLKLLGSLEELEAFFFYILEEQNPP